MPYPSPYSTLIEETDPIKLDQELINLQREQLGLLPFQPQTGVPDEVNAIEAKSYNLYLQSLIRRQIAIIAKLRQTQTGPAKSGTATKRSKRAGPIDIRALTESLMASVNQENQKPQA